MALPRAPPGVAPEEAKPPKLSSLVAPPGSGDSLFPSVSRPYSAPITLLAPSRPDTGDSGGEGVPGPRREANSRQPAWVNLPREGRRGSWGMQAGGPGECISLTLDTGLKCRAAGTVRWRRWGQTWIGGGRRQPDLTVEQSPECPGLHWLSHACLGIRTNSAWPCSLIRAAGP